MKCFYHKADLDGHCSGAIIKSALPECEMIGVDYSDELNKSEISVGEKVFVVDFSFSIESMIWLHENCDLRWIDHHKSAIEKMGKYDDCIFGLRAIGKAGCELTWEYMRPRDPMPLAVRLLGRYDVWDHSDERVLPFQYSMRDQCNTLPDADIWQAILFTDESVEGFVNHGKIILEYQEKQDAKYAKSMAYEAEFHGLRAIVMNKPFANSKAFDAVYDPEKHDIMILYGFRPSQFKYSLFCNKPEIDVSAIAVKYGGGGHRGAAGFYHQRQVV